MIIANYNLALTRYLVQCCMRHELACSDVTNEAFEENAKTVLEHWDEILHPHKALVDKSRLEKSFDGSYITFPSIVRNLAIERASNIPGSPCYGWKYDDKHAYCAETMGRCFNQ